MCCLDTAICPFFISHLIEFDTEYFLISNNPMSCVAESSMLFSHRPLSDLNVTDNISLNVILLP